MGGAPPRFSGKQRKRVLRFAIIGNGLPLAVATATDFSSHHTVFFIGAVGALLAPIGVAVFSDARRSASTRGPRGLPALTMMQAYSGGVASGYSILMMMAMVWFGIQTSDRAGRRDGDPGRLRIPADADLRSARLPGRLGPRDAARPGRNHSRDGPARADPRDPAAQRALRRTRRSTSSPDCSTAGAGVSRRNASSGVPAGAAPSQPSC